MRGPGLRKSGPSLFQHRWHEAPAIAALDYLTTVNVMVVEWVVVPAWFPVDGGWGRHRFFAVLATLRVKSDVPEPVMDVGL